MQRNLFDFIGHKFKDYGISSIFASLLFKFDTGRLEVCKAFNESAGSSKSSQILATQTNLLNFLMTQIELISKQTELWLSKIKLTRFAIKKKNLTTPT